VRPRRLSGSNTRKYHRKDRCPMFSQPTAVFLLPFKKYPWPPTTFRGKVRLDLKLSTSRSSSEFCFLFFCFQSGSGSAPPPGLPPGSAPRDHGDRCWLCAITLQLFKIISFFYLTLFLQNFFSFSKRESDIQHTESNKVFYTPGKTCFFSLLLLQLAHV